MLERLLTLPDDPITAPDGRLRLRRAWPRGTGHLVVEYRRDDGGLVPGQWFADRAQTERVAEQIGRRCPGARVRVEPAADGAVVLQPDGADRRLPGLRDVLARDGTTLVSHRPERRAVVRRDGIAGTSFVKAVRPARVHGLLGPLRDLARAETRPFAIPEIEAVDEAEGTVTLAALPGAPLHDRPAAAATGVVSCAVGRALRWMHERYPGDALAHGPAEEIALLRDRMEQLRPYAPKAATAAAPVAEEVCAALGASTGERVPLHRDFYDKQIVVDDAGGIGLLDFDTLAIGEAALDVANMLAHLELRVVQEGVDEAVSLAHGAAFLEGYAPSAAVRARLGAYLDASRVRLACLYALRPRWAHLTDVLLARVGASSPMDELVVP